MKKSQRSVVRRGITPANAGRPLVPPLSPSVMYHYESASHMQMVHDDVLEGFTYARDAIPMAQHWLRNCPGWRGRRRV